MTVIHRCKEAIEAGCLIDLLNQEGVAATLEDYHNSAFDGLLLDRASETAIVVNEEDVERAKAVLGKYLGSLPSTPEIDHDLLLLERARAKKNIRLAPLGIWIAIPAFVVFGILLALKARDFSGWCAAGLIWCITAAALYGMRSQLRRDRETVGRIDRLLECNDKTDHEGQQ